MGWGGVEETSSGDPIVAPDPKLDPKEGSDGRVGKGPKELGEEGESTAGL